MKLKIDYLTAALDTEVNMAPVAETTQTIYTEYCDVFTGIGCFRCTFLCR